MTNSEPTSSSAAASSSAQTTPPSDAERAELEKEALVLAELKERAKAAPLYYYKPHEKAAAFHRSRAPIRAITGGNRSGKSEAGCVEACAAAIGYRPWVLRELGIPAPADLGVRPDNLPPEALVYNTAGVRISVPCDVFVVTAQAARKGINETCWPKIKHYLGPLVKKSRIGHGGSVSDVELTNGSRIVFGSAEQGPMAFESTNYAAVYGDEPWPREIWAGIRRGMVDQCGPIWLAFTPVGPNAAWLFNEILSVADGERVFAVEVSIHDNPYLSREAIEAFVNDPILSEAEREARVFGRYGMLSDRIYAFDDTVHVIEPFRPPRSWTVGMSVDPHNVRPWAIAYFAIAPSGDVLFFKEWPTAPFHKIRRDQRSIEEYVKIIRELDSNHNVGPRLIDPNAGPRKDVLRGIYIPSFVDELASYGLHFHHRINDSLTYGETLVRRLMAFKKGEPLGPLNRPRLYVTHDCSNIISALKYYSAKPKPGTLNDPSEDKRCEDYKDFADVVRYAVASGVAECALSDSLSAFEELNPDASTPRSYV